MKIYLRQSASLWVGSRFLEDSLKILSLISLHHWEPTFTFNESDDTPMLEFSLHILFRWGIVINISLNLNSTPLIGELAYQWRRGLFRCRIDLLNFPMGFNIINTYMEFIHFNWYIAELYHLDILKTLPLPWITNPERILSAIM